MAQCYAGADLQSVTLYYKAQNLYEALIVNSRRKDESGLQKINCSPLLFYIENKKNYLQHFFPLIVEQNILNCK